MKRGLIAAGLLVASVTIVAAKEQAEMINHSLDELRRLVPVAGAPADVVWQRNVLGSAGGGFPPGPTDEMLWVVLSYDSAEEVQQLVSGGLTEDVVIEAPDWFPENLHPGAGLDVVRHHRVEGFMDAEVMTVPGQPQILLLKKPLF
ncbi:hypothetical protein [Paracoccus sp. (in: a-proteobacteria)]|uniref:hypothetical protein n=1 Tax=Paracoccus sp. TaxID=267 RepID=UPI003A8B257D